MWDSIIEKNEAHPVRLVLFTAILAGRELLVLSCLGTTQDRSRAGYASFGVHHLHLVPIVRKFVSAIQADYVGSCDGSSLTAALLSANGDWEAATFVRTTEERFEQPHKPSPRRSSCHDRSSTARL